MNFLKKLAPFIAAAASLGGPLGALAGNALTSALNLKSGGQVTDVIAALTTTPLTADQMAAIKRADNDFAAQMHALDIKSVEDIEKMADDDRASARAREIETKDPTPRNLAYLITVGFFAILTLKMFHVVSSDIATQTVVNVMLGSLGTAWIAIVQYYFGSSKGSDDKTKIIGDIAKS